MRARSVHFSKAALLGIVSAAWLAQLAHAAGAATHFSISAPAGATAGSAFSFTVTALDASNSTATAYTGIVHFTSTDGAATLPANATLTNGSGTFSSTLKTTGNQILTATDTVTSSITGSSGSIALSPAAATHFAVSAPASATAGNAFSFTITALDQFNNTAKSYAGMAQFTSSDGQAVLPSNTTISNGTGTFSATLKTSGTRNLSATDTVTVSITGTSNSVTVSAAAATHFNVSTPANATAGTAFTFTVTAQDAFNNTASSYAGVVHFTSSDGSATLPANSTLTNGSGTFSSTLKTAGNQTITATDTVNSSITGTSSAVAASAAATTHFSVSAPSSAVAGNSFNFTVTALDQFNNTASSYSGTVHFTSTDGQVTLPADTTLTMGSNIFSMALKTAGNQTVSVTDTVTSSITGTSGAISVSAAGASRFVVSAPASATAGSAFSFVVTAQDSFNNTAVGYNGIVQFKSTDGQATLPNNTTLTNGTGVFSATLRTAGNQTIAAADTVNASITGISNAVAVSAAAAKQFSVTAPAGAIKGSAFSFSVKAQDQFNNTATSYAGTVHFTSSDGAAVLPANSTLTSGVGTFSTTLNTAGTQTLTATDTTTATITGTSASVSVTLPANHFTLVAPASATQGTAFNVTVTALDSSNNTVVAYAGTVHFSSSDAAAVLPANAPLTNGTGTFSVTLKKVGAQTLTATDTILATLTATGSVPVANASPTPAIIGAPASGMLGTTINLSSTVIDPGGSTESFTFAWSALLGGNQVASGTDATFNFTPSSEGTFTVNLTVTDSNGGAGSGSVTVSVNAVPTFLSAPSATPNPGFTDLALTFRATLSPADSALTWDFGDGSPPGSGEGAQHIYTATGTFNVSVTAKNPRSGSSAAAQLAVTIQDIATGATAQLPGTDPLSLKKATLTLKSKKDKVVLTGTLPIAVGMTIDGALLSLSLNGFSETFKLSAKGSATTADAKVKLGFKQKKGVVQAGEGKFSITLSGATLSPALSTGVSTNDKGLPKKLEIVVVFGGKTESLVTGLTFQVSKSSATAKVGK